MALPTAIREAAERAAALQTKFKAGTLTVEDVGSPINAPTNADIRTPAPAVIPSQPAPAAAAPQPQSAPAPAPAPVTAAPLSPEEAGYQHKFSVLQGKYNAEVPRLHEQNRTLTAQMQSMQAQLASTQSLLATLGQQQAVDPAPAGNSPLPRLVKDEEVKTFGADLYDFIQRTSREAILPEIDARVQRQVGPVAQQVQQQGSAVAAVTQQQSLTVEQQFYITLDRLKPDWEQINGTEPFGNWLNQHDPYAGTTRGAMLAQAFQNGDAPRVAQFFTGFQRENAVVSPSGATPPAAQGAIPAVSLASLAAPGTGNGGPQTGAPNEAGQRTYTAADISAFFRDKQKGAYRGKEAEALAIERDIFVAQKQGRVRVANR